MITLQARNTKCTYPAGQQYQVHLLCRPAILRSALTLQASYTQKCAYPAGQQYSEKCLPCRPAILRKVLNLQASNTQKCTYPSGQQYSGVHLPFRPAMLGQEATLQARNTKCSYPAGWQCSNCANALQISSTCLQLPCLC